MRGHCGPPRQATVGVLNKNFSSSLTFHMETFFGNNARAPTLIRVQNFSLSPLRPLLDNVLALISLFSSPAAHFTIHYISFLSARPLPSSPRLGPGDKLFTSLRIFRLGFLPPGDSLLVDEVRVWEYSVHRIIRRSFLNDIFFSLTK